VLLYSLPFTFIDDIESMLKSVQIQCGAFCQAELVEVVIPQMITFLGEDCFGCCKSVSSVIFCTLRNNRGIRRRLCGVEAVPVTFDCLIRHQHCLLSEGYRLQQFRVPLKTDGESQIPEQKDWQTAWRFASFYLSQCH
jgi:hypothetical protein